MVHLKFTKYILKYRISLNSSPQSSEYNIFFNYWNNALFFVKWATKKRKLLTADLDRYSIWIIDTSSPNIYVVNGSELIREMDNEIRIESIQLKSILLRSILIWVNGAIMEFIE